MKMKLGISITSLIMSTILWNRNWREDQVIITTENLIKIDSKINYLTIERFLFGEENICEALTMSINLNA